MRPKTFNVDALTNMLNGTTLTIQEALDIVTPNMKEKELYKREKDSIGESINQCETCRVWYEHSEFPEDGNDCNYCSESLNYEDED